MLLHGKGWCAIAGSPSSASKHRSSYSSIGAPIQLGSQQPTSTSPSLQAASARTAQAASSSQQQQPEAPPPHRLGKATPLKKSFTPRPSRFRLEAERLSVTPPDKPSGLEKVLFRSPVKADKLPAYTLDAHLDSTVSCTGDAPSQALAQHMDEDGVQAALAMQDEAQPDAMLISDDQEMVTPANPPNVASLLASQGVFAHMRVILDPELTPEESNRYAANYKAND